MYQSIDFHQNRIINSITALTATETLPLLEAHGRVLATDVVSPIDLQPWDNSAMDGFALNSADAASASTEEPVTLEVVGEIPAGDTHPTAPGPHQAVAIMTGAPVPEGIDTIVPIEKVVGYDPTAQTAGVAIPKSITVDAPAAADMHIRRRGEDVHAADTVVTSATRLAPHHLGAIAAVSVPEVTVIARPRFAVIATGDELRAPGQPLGMGLIPDSNSTLVASLLQHFGAETPVVTRVGDTPGELETLLDSLEEIDGIILTGGASVGAHDVSKQVLENRGVKFYTVNMQPGKPQGFGLAPKPTWVLPGNPVSVLISCHLFISPAVAAFQGRKPELKFEQRTVFEGWKPTKGRNQLMPVVSNANGVQPASDRGSKSHLAARMARADGMAFIPAEVTEVRPGDAVGYYPFERF